MGRQRAGLGLSSAAMVLLLAAPLAEAMVVLQTGRTRVEIDTVGALPVTWMACAGDCANAGARWQAVAGPGAGTVTWSGPAADAMVAIEYAAVVTDTSDALVAVLTARQSVQGRLLVQRYELSRHTHALRMELQAPPGVAVELRSGAAFVPAPLPGFGAAFGGVEAVRLDASGQQGLDADVEVAADPSAWIGVRQRFWAWVARPAAPAATASVSAAAANRPTLSWNVQDGKLALDVYAGPVEWKSLRVVDEVLTQMLFAALWEPLRWLCYGLLFLLGLIMRWVDNPGVGIILLSLLAKLILWPLTRIADRWQQEVNRTQGRLQPRLAEVRRHYKGEEAHNRTLQVYREEGVHPLFTMKSLAGFAIQVPMFIAAFDMLADNFALSGQSFLWIDDLTAPDRIAALPVAIPFFGADLNLLPAVMTLLTVLAALTQHDDSLTPEMLRRQRLQLYAMAVAFFLLFYTFPAGMVLYWTANNFWHLLKVQAVQRFAARGAS